MDLLPFLTSPGHPPPSSYQFTSTYQPPTPTNLHTPPPSLTYPTTPTLSSLSTHTHTPTPHSPIAESTNNSILPFLHHPPRISSCPTALAKRIIPPPQHEASHPRCLHSRKSNQLLHQCHPASTRGSLAYTYDSHVSLILYFVTGTWLQYTTWL